VVGKLFDAPPPGRLLSSCVQKVRRGRGKKEMVLT